MEYLISPLTGQPIPASKMAEHMRIGLLDPNWVEQRKTEIQKKKEEEDYYAQVTKIIFFLNLFLNKSNVSELYNFRTHRLSLHLVVLRKNVPIFSELWERQESVDKSMKKKRSRIRKLDGMVTNEQV